jgi:hypothetical protein
LKSGVNVLAVILQKAEQQLLDFGIYLNAALRGRMKKKRERERVTSKRRS